MVLRPSGFYKENNKHYHWKFCSLIGFCRSSEHHPKICHFGIVIILSWKYLRNSWSKKDILNILWTAPPPSLLWKKINLQWKVPYLYQEDRRHPYHQRKRNLGPRRPYKQILLLYNILLLLDQTPFSYQFFINVSFLGLKHKCAIPLSETFLLWFLPLILYLCSALVRMSSFFFFPVNLFVIRVSIKTLKR